jgi:uncharacterized membrane protein
MNKKKGLKDIEFYDTSLIIAGICLILLLFSLFFAAIVIIFDILLVIFYLGIIMPFVILWLDILEYLWRSKKVILFILAIGFAPIFSILFYFLYLRKLLKKRRENKSHVKTPVRT